MPLYDYECESCGQRFELKQGFEAEPVGTCPRCEGRARRKFHAVPIIYKGTGFYTTDYKRSGAASTGTGADHDNGEKTEKKGAKNGASAEASPKLSESKAHSKTAETKSSEAKSSGAKTPAANTAD